MARVGIGDSLEGLHAVRAAIRAGRVRRLVIQRSHRDKLLKLAEEARASGATVEIVDDLGDLAQTSAPQGVVATALPLPTVSLKELVGAAGAPAVVVADHLEDAHNVGAIARTAAAVGMSGLVVSSRRAAPLGPAAFKAAAGAFEALPVAVVSSVAEAVRSLKQLGVWSVGLDAHGDASVFGMELLSEPVALVVGGEGRGLSDLVKARVDVLAGVPMARDVQSLNVSVAAAIGMYEIMRVRRASAAADESVELHGSGAERRNKPG